ncbi:ComF family protein [Ferrimonas balearica]|uniref:ComF family protein n=1 Tax=Ferrimonas balearica TaxID=44012 RepID=UPI001C999B17|nr:ComF family protein [Ferrimonas balearica]MBY5923542.1 ComF family protein [Ferrimonas balearica]MBY5997909.1 ComF family protein [Ferrimonas balearica]
MDVSFWLKRLLGVMERSLPNRCLLCQQPCSEGQGLCEVCLADGEPGPLCLGCSRPMPAPVPWRCGRCLSKKRWRPLVCAYPYHHPLGYLAGAIKIQRRLSLLPPLTEALAQRLETLWSLGAIPRPDALLPVPMHPSKLPTRGFNHSVLIARALGKRLNLPVIEGRVIKQRQTQDQHGLSGADRRRNLKGSFAVLAGPRLTNLALVDDVVTTGTTFATLAATLRRQGHSVSQYWALASALH